jgi:hypothetical protein
MKSIVPGTYISVHGKGQISVLNPLCQEQELLHLLREAGQVLLTQDQGQEVNEI